MAVDVQLAMAEKALARVRSRGVDAALMVGDGGALPLADAAFDRAFLVAVLGELPDQVGALREVGRVLRRGGVVAVCEEFVAPDYLFPAEVDQRLAAAGGQRLAERATDAAGPGHDRDAVLERAHGRTIARRVGRRGQRYGAAPAAAAARRRGSLPATGRPCPLREAKRPVPPAPSTLRRR
jgi:SAM-dependent methyltransferase